MRVSVLPPLLPALTMALLLALAGMTGCGKAGTPTPGPGGADTMTTQHPPPPPPSPPFRTLNYLYSISGTKTVSGIHNREPNNTPAVWTDSIYATTGKFPGFWSGDF